MIGNHRGFVIDEDVDKEAFDKALGILPASVVSNVKACEERLIDAIGAEAAAKALVAFAATPPVRRQAWLYTVAARWPDEIPVGHTRRPS